ncbi:MAG: response regulator [Myxococcota bacterium]|nr:response regulator [Myxococcota bacterium]
MLIVDDEFGLADVLSHFLTDLGYVVSIAINGKLALDSLAANLPDIVLTDAMMPVMDGPEMIRRMRADPRFAAIPAILMTALPEAVPEGEAGQHDAVLLKPFSLSELLETMEPLMKPRSS